MRGQAAYRAFTIVSFSLCLNSLSYAHRLALLAASDTFRAMFDGEYKERTAPLIPIPNIRYEVCPA